MATTSSRPSARSSPRTPRPSRRSRRRSRRTSPRSRSRRRGRRGSRSWRRTSTSRTRRATRRRRPRRLRRPRRRPAEMPAAGASSEGLEEALLELQRLTERLRSDCPWDREQTAATIVPHTVEESYEVADAALFGDDEAPTAERVRSNWERIKREQEGREGIFHDVAEGLPGLLYARKIQQRAKAVGFEYPDLAGALADRAAARRAAQRFRRRVEVAEELAEEKGENWSELPLERQDAYFDQAKEKE